MSDIFGEGHGSDHNWKHSHTSEGRQTLYKCVDCGHVFWHDYPHVPDIFEAMKKDGVPATCSKKPIEVHLNTSGCEPMTPETAEALGRVFKAVHDQYSEPK